MRWWGEMHSGGLAEGIIPVLEKSGHASTAWMNGLQNVAKRGWNSDFAEEISIRLINLLPVTCSAMPFGYTSVLRNSCGEGVIATKVQTYISCPWTNNCTKMCMFDFARFWLHLWRRCTICGYRVAMEIATTWELAKMCMSRLCMHALHRHGLVDI